MMKLLALAACVDSYEGPWIIARGSESAAKVSGLRPEEVVCIEVETDGPFNIKFQLTAGINILHDTKEWKRYRVLKEAPSDDKGPVTVEIFFSANKQVA